MEPTGRINCRSQEAASRSRYRPLGVPSPAGRTAARGAEDDYARPADPEIRFVHIAAVIASGSLFFIPGWRWSAGNRGARWCRSVAPVLLIIVAIAGLAFGNDAAEGAIVRQLGGSMGDATATAIEGMIMN